MMNYQQRLRKTEQEQGLERDPLDAKVLVDKKGNKRCARCFHDGSVDHAEFCANLAWIRKVTAHQETSDKKYAATEKKNAAT